MKILLPLTLTALLLAGCGAVTSPGGSPASGSPRPASDELIGQGTVLSTGDGPAMLCLGPVMESYPPQCSGPEIVGWDWTQADASESANGVTWGTYAVQGRWDGTTFTVTRPPTPLALYDPPANIDPRTDPTNPGAGTESELADLQSTISSDPDVLMTWIENGYLFVTVTYDDGALQSAYDARYGADVVAVQSSLQPVKS